MRKCSILVFSYFLCTTIIGVLAKPEKYAVLVATSKGFLFYRHQATVLHAYHTLLSNGFKKDNIITMFYDDIVNHPKNPDKGEVRNQPNGTNLYVNLKKDYTGDKVNANTFYAILTGDAATAKGPVLKSNPKDYVFVYVVGFGGFGFIGFANGPPLVANKFMDAIIKLRTQKKAKKVLVYLETPMSASLVNGLVPRKNGIFVMTATNFDEYPAACYCIPERKTCYGSLFGCAWTERSDRLRQLKSGIRTTLFDVFNTVRTWVPYSHVNMYGHLEIGTTKVKDFLNYKLVPKKKKAAERRSRVTEKLAQAALDKLEKDDYEGADEKEIDALFEFMGGEDDTKSAINEDAFGSVLHPHDVLSAMDPEDDENGNSISSVEENREFVKQTMENIYGYLKSTGLDVPLASNPAAPLSDEAANVYNEAIRAFDSKCFNINQNTFVHGELGMLAALAVHNIGLVDQIKAMDAVCGDRHRSASAIH